MGGCVLVDLVEGDEIGIFVRGGMGVIGGFLFSTMECSFGDVGTFLDLVLIIVGDSGIEGN